MFTERYGTCGISAGNVNAGTTFGNLWSDSNSVWRAVFCINNSSQSPGAAGYPACNMFQVTPIPYSTCDNARAQSPHAAGIHVGLGDGSVRMVGPSITAATWAQACDPLDGLTPSLD